MTSRELVHRTLRFDAPARTPRQLWVLPWAQLHHPQECARIAHRFADDLVSAPACWQQAPRGTGDRYAPGFSTDEWDCRFQNVQAGIIGEVKTPQITNWGRVATVRIPIERLSVSKDQVNAFCRDTERYVLAGTCPRPFERLQFLRGSHNLYLDLIDQPAELAQLLERLHAFYMDELAIWAATEVDALFFMDDWGSQRSLLVSPELWRRMFKPLYRDYIDLAHRHGKACFMHSDGYIRAIIPDLIELGLDALNTQVFCMDVAELGEQFGGRLTFWGELDRQHILPSGTQADVIAAVEQLRAAFWHQGGFIAQCEFGPGAKPENIITFLEAWDS